MLQNLGLRKERIMNSFEWEVFKRTGKIEHFLLLKDVESDRIGGELSPALEPRVEDLKEES